MTKLPSGWAIAPIGAVAALNPALTTTARADDLLSFIPMASVEEETGRIDAAETRRFEELRSKSYRSFQEGDVLFAKITPCMENGKVAIARGLKGGCGFGSTEFHVLRPAAGIAPGYLLYFLLQSGFRRDAARYMTGTAGQMRVPSSYLATCPVPIPPTEEQERIVASIEEQVSRIDVGVAAVQSAKQRLASLLKSILFRAVPSKPPPDWSMITVGEAGDVRLGRQRSPKFHHGPDMRPYLRVANVFEDRIDSSDIMTMQFDKEEFEAYRLAPGDILLNEGQSPHLLGRPAMYHGEPPDIAFTNSLIRFRAWPNILPEWALLVFRRYLHGKRFMRESQITTNIAHLSAGRFKSVEFPVPSLSEQRRIVAEVQHYLSLIAATKATLKSQLRRSSALRSSLLREAFAGNLVAQEPNDEPASALLERIAAERLNSERHKVPSNRVARRSFPAVKA